jgi:hypothetical protein
MLDAGRGEVYGGLRRVGSDGTVAPVVEDRVGTPSEILDDFREMFSDSPLVIVGDGAGRYRADLEGLACRSGIELVTVSHVGHTLKSWQFKTEVDDRARALGRFAARLVRAGNWPGIEAYYIRPSDAEIRRKDQHE